MLFRSLGQKMRGLSLGLAFLSGLISIGTLKAEPLPHWEPGQLDIYHFHTGNGDTSFMMLPDGTTLVFDIGEINHDFRRNVNVLRVTDPSPDASKRPGQWVAHFIDQILPEGAERKIDYAVISHFHPDHYGWIVDHSPLSQRGAYKLTGITDLDELMPIDTLIDRAAGTYDFPVDLRRHYQTNETFQNYLLFVETRQREGMDVQRLSVGSKSQIILKNRPQDFPYFQIRGVKNNGHIWTGQGETVTEYFTADDVVSAEGTFNENPLSMALLIEYGTFSYFAGGDITGLQGFGLPYWFDQETPVAKAVGLVDVITLNHHGHRDATSPFFLRSLQPRVFIQQTWTSDHPGQEIVHWLDYGGLYPGPKDLFATYVFQETIQTYGNPARDLFNKPTGHILVRVAEGGGSYSVFVLDSSSRDLSVLAEYGPFTTD